MYLFLLLPRLSFHNLKTRKKTVQEESQFSVEGSYSLNKFGTEYIMINNSKLSIA